MAWLKRISLRAPIRLIEQARHRLLFGGAGDCFAGALMARLVAGDDYWAALRYANAAAALTTMGYGAVAPLPRPVNVRALLETAP